MRVLIYLIKIAAEFTSESCRITVTGILVFNQNRIRTTREIYVSRRFCFLNLIDILSLNIQIDEGD